MTPAIFYLSSELIHKYSILRLCYYQTHRMRLILNQNYQGDRAEKVVRDDEYPGLRAGDVIVSEAVERKIREYLNQQQQQARK